MFQVPQVAALRRSFVTLFCCFASLPMASAEEVTQIDLILDSSGSMRGKIKGQTKMDIAKRALAGIVDDLSQKKNVRVALRVYGHQNKRCDNTVLEAPMAEVNAASLRSKVQALKPKGATPISLSLTEAAKDFDSGLRGERIIVLITDGLESCKADPCATARALKKAGVVTRMHVVGFGLNKKSLKALECVVAPSKGRLFGASDAQQLTKALGRIVQQTVGDNFLLTAKDDRGKSTLARFEIYAVGSDLPVASGDTSYQQRGNASLAPGSYNVKVTHSGTKAVLWFREVEVPEQGQVSREALFAKRELKVKLRGPKGELRLANVYVYDKSGKELKMADTSYKSRASFTLLPGVVDLKLEDYKTKKILWLRDVDLTKEEQIEKIVEFK